MTHPIGLPGQNGWLSAGLALIAFAFIHSLLIILGNEFYFEPDYVAIIWPATGWLLGALLVTQKRIWPAVILTATIVQVIVQLFIYDGPFARTVLFGLNNIPGPLLGAWLVRRMCNGIPSLEKLTDVLKLILIGATASSIITAVGGAGLKLSNDIANYWDVFRIWWLSDILGVLATATIVLAFSSGAGWAIKHSHWKSIELFVLLGGLLLVCVHVFGSNHSDIFIILEQPYMIFPFLLWAALRFGGRSLTIALLVTSFTSIYFADKGLVPFFGLD